MIAKEIIRVINFYTMNSMTPIESISMGSEIWQSLIQEMPTEYDFNKKSTGERFFYGYPVVIDTGISMFHLNFKCKGSYARLLQTRNNQ